MALRLPRDRFAQAFWALIAVTFVLTAILGWQAIESQEVKGSLRGGLDAPVEVAGGRSTVTASYVNDGDRAVTLESAALVEPDAVEVVDWRAGAAGDGARAEVEGYQVAPGEIVEITALVRSTAAEAGFSGFRLHYHAGGRAGQTAG